MHGVHLGHAITALVGRESRSYLRRIDATPLTPGVIMSFADLTRLGLRPSRTGAVLSHLTDAFVSWKDARATRRALTRLSPHELDDIGLTPGDIDRISRRGY